MMAKESSEPNFLSKAFMAVAKAATVGLVIAVAWQIFLDPIFFPIFHDPSNATAQALVSMIHTNFAWIPELIGLTGDGGFLNTEFAQAVLSPYYAPSPETIAQIGGSVAAVGMGSVAANADFSLDDL